MPETVIADVESAGELVEDETTAATGRGGAGRTPSQWRGRGGAAHASATHSTRRVSVMSQLPVAERDEHPDAPAVPRRRRDRSLSDKRTAPPGTNVSGTRQL